MTWRKFRHSPEYAVDWAIMKTIALALLALLVPLSAQAEIQKRILLVVSNHGQLGNTGKQTGFFLSEAAHPWEVFRKAGFAVEIASPKGGFAPVDPKSFDLADPINKEFWATYGFEKGDRKGIRRTQPLEKVDPRNFAAVFYAGGHGAVWDFPDSKGVQKVTAAIYEKGGVVGAVCHGPAALVNVKLSDGTYLVNGKKVAPFTNAEEAKVELTNVVPFLLQDRLEKVGALSKPAKNFQKNAVRDGRLVTGQNPASATLAAELVVKALASR